MYNFKDVPNRPCHKAAILPRGTKKALFYHDKPHPHGFQLSVVKQSSFGLPGQYGRRVTRVNLRTNLRHLRLTRRMYKFKGGMPVT